MGEPHEERRSSWGKGEVGCRREKRMRRGQGREEARRGVSDGLPEWKLPSSGCNWDEDSSVEENSSNTGRKSASSYRPFCGTMLREAGAARGTTMAGTFCRVLATGVVDLKQISVALRKT